MLMVCDHSKNLVRNLEGMLVCPECGEVIDELNITADTGIHIDEETKSHEYNDNIGSRTVIGMYKYDKIKNKRLFYKLNKINNHKYGWERTYIEVKNKIKMYNFNESIIYGSINLAKKIVKSTKLTGKTIDGLAKFVLYYYIRTNYNIPSKEIIKKLDVEEKGEIEVVKTINRFTKYLKDIKYNGRKIIDPNKMKRQSLESTIEYYCQKIGLERGDINNIIQSSKILDEYITNGKTLTTYAAAFIYDYFDRTDKRIAQNKVARMLSISEVSLRVRTIEIRVLRKAKDLLSRYEIDKKTKKRLINGLLKKVSNGNATSFSKSSKAFKEWKEFIGRNYNKIEDDT